MGTLASGVSVTLQIQAQVVSVAPQTNTATVSHGDQFDPDLSNNTASVTAGPLGKRSLSGFVWVDLNNNAIRDPWERGIPGVTVRLVGADARGNPVDATVVTDAGGNFSFLQVLSGTYRLLETQPPAYLDGQDAAGSLGGIAGNDTIDGIVLLGDADGTDYRFGELGLRSEMISKRFFLSTPMPLPEPGGSGFTSVNGSGPADPSGHVFLDRNGNGVFDPGEPGLAGVLIRLNGVTADGAPVSQQTRTDAAGFYSFGGLPGGVYSLEEAQPVGYRVGASTVGTRGGVAGPGRVGGIVLGPGEDATGYDFAQLPLAALDAIFSSLGKVG